MKFNYNHPTYRAARALAFARSNGLCQFCGLTQAEDSHHWARGAYKKPENTTADDLIALCRMCHKLVGVMRFQIRKNHLKKYGHDMGWARRIVLDAMVAAMKEIRDADAESAKSAKSEGTG